MKSLDGPWYVPILSLLSKCKKLQIDSNRSIEIIEPNIGVAKIDFFFKYDLSVIHHFKATDLNYVMIAITFVSYFISSFQRHIKPPVKL